MEKRYVSVSAPGQLSDAPMMINAAGACMLVRSCFDHTPMHYSVVTVLPDRFRGQWSIRLHAVCLMSFSERQCRPILALVGMNENKYLWWVFLNRASSPLTWTEGSLLPSPSHLMMRRQAGLEDKCATQYAKHVASSPDYAQKWWLYQSLKSLTTT